ncbi:MAG: hypothetical protein FJX57_07905 [Alphaproteobacteria bacterium]|nr:hypothetical protein [Alphaproteobacteria bacterium]
MKLFVGVTDSDWFELLRSQPAVDEVNFWQPGGSRQFKTLQEGELFLFKLHAPKNFIVGGGVFFRSFLAPLSLAWEAFGMRNGARTPEEMRARVTRYRRDKEPDVGQDYQVGCIVLTQPFFWSEERWIPVPESWAMNIVSGRTYDLADADGRRLWAPAASSAPHPNAPTRQRATHHDGAQSRSRTGSPDQGVGCCRHVLRSAAGRVLADRRGAVGSIPAMAWRSIGKDSPEASHTTLGVPPQARAAGSQVHAAPKPA